MRQEFTFLFIVILASFFLRIIFFDTSYFIWDETIYLMHGKLFAGQNAGYEETFLRPPLLPLIASFAWRVSAEHYEIAAKFAIIFLNSFIVIPVYYLGRLINKKTAMLSAIIAAALPASILNSRYVLTDHLGAILALAAFLLFFIGAWEKEKSAYLYFGGFALALSILMKFTNLFLFILLLPIFIILMRKRIKNLFISMLIFSGVMLPYIIYNYVKFNNPLYVFLNAWHVVRESTPTDISFILYIFNDTFGLIFLIFAFAGLALFIRLKLLDKKIPSYERLFSGILAYAFLLMLIYFINIVGKGVARPPTIEWEVERFMLLLVPFVIVFSSYGLVYLAGLLKNKMLSTIAAILFLIAGFSLLNSQYLRAYTPQIEFENGLRDATKEMGIFLKDSNISMVGCVGNCPPIAFYSGKKLDVYYSIDDLFESKNKCMVLFEPNTLNSLAVVKSICKKSHCAYLYCSEKVM